MAKSDSESSQLVLLPGEDGRSLRVDFGAWRGASTIAYSLYAEETQRNQVAKAAGMSARLHLGGALGNNSLSTAPQSVW